MCKRFRRDVARRHFLQPIIADRCCRAQSGFDVALFEQSALLCGVRPNARETIRLQLEPHGRRIRAVHGSLLRSSLDAKNILNVMADLVGQDVGLREFAWRPKAPLQLVVKAEVDVDSLVFRTVKGSGGGFGAAACGLGVVAE